MSVREEPEQYRLIAFSPRGFHSSRFRDRGYGLPRGFASFVEDYGISFFDHDIIYSREQG